MIWRLPIRLSLIVTMSKGSLLISADALLTRQSCRVRLKFLPWSVQDLRRLTFRKAKWSSSMVSMVMRWLIQRMLNLLIISKRQLSLPHKRKSGLVLRMPSLFLQMAKKFCLAQTSVRLMTFWAQTIMALKLLVCSVRNFFTWIQMSFLQKMNNTKLTRQLLKAWAASKSLFVRWISVGIRSFLIFRFLKNKIRSWAIVLFVSALTVRIFSVLSFVHCFVHPSTDVWQSCSQWLQPYKNSRMPRQFLKKKRQTLLLPE